MLLPVSSLFIICELLEGVSGVTVEVLASVVVLGSVVALVISVGASVAKENDKS